MASTVLYRGPHDNGPLAEVSRDKAIIVKLLDNIADFESLYGAADVPAVLQTCLDEGILVVFIRAAGAADNERVLVGREQRHLVDAALALYEAQEPDWTLTPDYGPLMDDVEAHAQAGAGGPGDFGYARASADRAAINAPEATHVKPDDGDTNTYPVGTAYAAAAGRPYRILSDFQRQMLETLQSGGSVKITPQRGQEGMAAEQQAAMEELVAMGLARRSASGRYWGPDAGGAGRPEVGEPVNVRLGEFLPQVDEFAASHGLSRAAAIRELVSRGLGG